MNLLIKCMCMCVFFFFTECLAANVIDSNDELRKKNDPEKMLNMLMCVVVGVFVYVCYAILKHTIFTIAWNHFGCAKRKRKS